MLTFCQFFSNKKKLLHLWFHEGNVVKKKYSGIFYYQLQKGIFIFQLALLHAMLDYSKYQNTDFLIYKIKFKKTKMCFPLLLRCTRLLSFFEKAAKWNFRVKTLLRRKPFFWRAEEFRREVAIERSINCFETVFNQTHETTNRNQYLFIKYLKRQSWWWLTSWFIVSYVQHSQIGTFVTVN